MSRVIALGLDAAEATLVDRLVEEGRLPHLARLRARAARARLRSPTPYRAEFPWTELMTGRRPETLRYWSTVTFDPTGYDAYMRGATDAEPFYAFGDAATVVAFDLPKVIRTPDVHGVQLLGWGAHSPQYPVGSSPPGLLAEIEAELGAHPGLPIEYAGSWHQTDFLEELGRAQAAGVRRRGEILRWLARRTPDWDLLLALVGETHQSGHVMGHGFGGLLADAPTAPVARDGMLRILRAIDDLVGEIVAWAPADATVVVFSAHGMAPADEETAGMLLPELLLRAGTGEARVAESDLRAWRRRGAPPVVPPPWSSPLLWMQERLALGPRPSPWATTRLRARDLVHRRAPALVRLRHRRAGAGHRRPDVPDVGPEGAAHHDEFPFHDRSMDDWHLAAWYRDAWPRLPAFMIPSYSDAHVRINLAGRERHGIVPPDDYHHACTQVEEVLRGTRDGRTGEPLVEDVTRMRADDPFAPDGPSADLVIRLRGTDALDHPELGTIGPAPAPRTGAHTALGFADVAGPGIEPRDLGEHAVRDLSATICALLERAPRMPLDGVAFLDPSRRG